MVARAGGSARHATTTDRPRLGAAGRVQYHGRTIREEVDDVARRKTGRFLGLPFDFRPLTRARLKERAWNADDRRLFTPKVFGWGYTINVREAVRRLGLRR